ncbi:type IX secretion system membrane protein PorP/SprF [Tenacibaculum singaporense]|uniref:Type IX secretion system membrane protein PorP/SprF n=3 Tax=Tenacibaculum singaporense TaxID=2358479 RepID=A0A3Q8RRY4_9FLAO|nr:type IX secretion system membrane protein PorP/SprF [Tenacibaculum singaporense]AZJ36002.1 type IX secretion system membrane protein PorP/SprF [Tenacibaculum singaporense]
MNHNYKLLQAVIVLFFTTVLTVQSQQLPQFTQYMYNTISINPAYAGSRQVLSIVGLHRSQWAGLDRAPETQTLSIHTPLRNDKIGLGLSFINDQLGYENFTYLYGDFSYTIQLNDDVKLAFGLKAGFTQYNIDDALIAAEGSDPGISGIQNRWEPNIGSGLLLHTNKWYVGLSAPRLLNIDHNDLEINGINYGVVDRVSYYLTGGYVFDLSDNVKFKPATLIKATNGAPVSYDITANFLFNEKFWLGGSYRINKDTGALGALVDFQVSRQFRIGYAYEHPLSDINQYSNGTHEILLMFELHKVNRVKSPRYF